MEWGGRILHMRIHNLLIVSCKGAGTGQPFISDNCQAILVAGSLDLPIKPLRGHVPDGTKNLDLSFILHILRLHRELSAFVIDYGYTKIAKANLVGTEVEHILWFYIAVNHFGRLWQIMGILQCVSNLSDIRSDFVQRE